MGSLPPGVVRTLQNTSSQNDHTGWFLRKYLSTDLAGGGLRDSRPSATRWLDMFHSLFGRDHSYRYHKTLSRFLNPKP